MRIQNDSEYWTFLGILLSIVLNVPELSGTRKTPEASKFDTKIALLSEVGNEIIIKLEQVDRVETAFSVELPRSFQGDNRRLHCICHCSSQSFLL